MESSPQKLLEALAAGQPIDGAEGLGVLSPDFTEAIAAASKAIKRARGLMPSGVREVYWITGRPGNGKTQSLRQLTLELLNSKAAGKYAHAYLDFDKEPAARGPEGLVPAFLRRTLAAGVVGEVEEVRDKIVRSTETDERIKGSIVLGIDLVSGLAGVPAPSLFIDPLFKHISAWFRGRDSYIRKKLAEKWPAHPQLMELMIAWMRYVLAPATKRGEELAGVLTRLATQGSLFDTFCFALQKANYSTLVLALDEVDSAALDSLKPLWDPPDPSSPLHHDLNIVLVIAAKQNVRERAEGNEALKRRFCRTLDGHYHLAGPRLDKSGNDDFKHVVDKVESLLQRASALRRKGLTPERRELQELRDKLDKSTDPSWQMLWEGVIRTLADM